LEPSNKHNNVAKSLSLEQLDTLRELAADSLRHFERRQAQGLMPVFRAKFSRAAVASFRHCGSGSGSAARRLLPEASSWVVSAVLEREGVPPRWEEPQLVLHRSSSGHSGSSGSSSSDSSGSSNDSSNHSLQTLAANLGLAVQITLLVDQHFPQPLGRQRVVTDVVDTVKQSALAQKPVDWLRGSAGDRDASVDVCVPLAGGRHLTCRVSFDVVLQ
jgi:hypothetical protein